MTGILGKLAHYRYQLILVLICCLIVTSGYWFIQEQKRELIEDACLNLATIADLKTSQIVAWRRERLIEATLLYQNSMVAHRITEHFKGAEETIVRREIRAWLEQMRDAGGYNKVMLFRPNGKLASAASYESTPPKSEYSDLARRAALSKELIFTDLHYDPGTDRIDIDIIIPVIDRRGGRNNCVAVLVIDINPYRHLYPLIRTFAAPSYSGETLLVRRDGNDVLYLSMLRFKPGAELRYRTPLNNTEMPAVQAVLGREGIISGIDYRGVPVYAALRTIPGSTWSIVVKTDTQEILEPVSERVWYVAGTCLLFALATAMALSLWWKRKREAYLRKQYETELNFNRELRIAEQSLLDANTHLEERVAIRTEELSNSNSQLRQEVAERKQVEELLRKHFHIIQQSPVAIILTDLGGSIEFVNPKFTEYSGYSYEEVIGQNPRIMKTEFTPPEVHKQLWETITAGRTWNGEFCNRRKNGEIFWEYAKILPFKDQDGNIASYMAFKEDITRHKQLEDKLAQSRKLETIGQIASGVAHEVRNPLNAILSISEALFREKEIEGNPEYSPYITHIRTQVNRLADLMNDLLDLGKPISPANAQVLPLLEFCRETMELWNVSGMAENRHGVVTAADETATTRVLADSVKLQQVIFNLLENSGHHSSSDCAIILHLAVPEPSSGMAVVRIIDRGRGIPEESIQRVFEPFYSNRRGGTGLGLSLVKHFIENMNGSVRIWNNDPPPGCTAEVRIPLATRESE
ncbi:MAG: PAS domain S-box protein [Desulfobacteraceae bacterium]|nr:PAS domain S-box protein [Desulfobacteraceae bacterium]